MPEASHGRLAKAYDPLLLSGDTHYYSRYFGNGGAYSCRGRGGAFHSLRGDVAAFGAITDYRH
jgi:hypothetical protein